MSQHVLKKPVLNLGALEDEIKRRLKIGKIKLIISLILFFILIVSVFFFAI
jgi:hypothetical protein